MCKNIAAFGEVMMRLEVPGYHLLSQSDQLTYSFSGTGVNIVSSLSKLGYNGFLISTLPKNPIGDAALVFLKKLGIHTSYVSQNGYFIGMYFLENGFGFRPSRVTYSNRLESSFNSANSEDYCFSEIADNIDLIHFCGISLAMNEKVRRQMKTLAKLVKNRGGTVLFDCNFRPSLWGENGNKKAKKHYEDMLQLADMVIMNEKDAIFTLELETEAIQFREQIQALIPKIAKMYDISLIAGTHREVGEDNNHSIQGYIYKDEACYFSDPINFPVLDRIGSGDAFTSGIIHGEIQGYSEDYSLSFAIASSILAHTVKGDTPMSNEEEIRQFIKQGGNDVIR